MRLRALALVVLGSIGGMTVADAASAGTPAAAPAGQHCVVHVVGQEPSGEYRLSAPSCYSTYAAAMRSLGVDTSGLRTVTPQSVAEAGLLSSTIGTHYDGSGYSGASISVGGVDCSGGYINLSVDWRNRVSSTSNGCPRIRHFSGLNLTGSSQDTVSPGGNLTTLNNSADSIQYLT